MKKLTVLLLLAQCIHAVSAQEQTNTAGFYSVPYASRSSGSYGNATHLITICYGIPSSLHGEINGVKDPNRTVIGPVKMHYEFSVHDEVGIAVKGLYVHGSWNYTDWLGYTEMRTSAWAIGANGYYHFNKLIAIERLDLFAGLGFYVGQQTLVWDTSYPDDIDRKIIATPTFSVGARYYLAHGFGVYTELGLTGGSIVDVGLTFRLH